ncbi:MAG: sigma-70 family RNA polymerase sigma factor [Chitinispirillia bacterium]|nr:sigma-70 family RNA polymerase sigma factor [Chitinispirillia bacterium]MCL2268462.1 sigma-70 family RNA polymerase sigma factor [Chitinispirillia bacterium]
MNTTTGVRRVDAGELFRKYWPMVLRRCQQMLCDADSAADAAQEIFMKVLDRQDSLREEYPSSLLWRMATNHCLNVIRSRAGRAEAADGESLLARIACAGNEEERHMSRGVLRKLFGGHPESSRTIAALHLVDGMTLEETAVEVNMSVSGVRKRLRALRETLIELERV